MLKKKLLFLMLIPFVLTACGNEEKELVAQAKEDFNALYFYDEDRIRPVIEEEKTPEELAKDYLMSSIDMLDEEPTFKERGVLENQGVFVESGIYDGNRIPNVSAISQEEADLANSEQIDVFADAKKEEFQELAEEREKVLEKQYEEDNRETERIEQEIERRANEYLQDNVLTETDEDTENLTEQENSEEEVDVE